MSRSDLIGGVLSTVLGVCLLLWLIPVWVEPDPDLRLPVSLVPQIVATGFVLCGMALCVAALRRYGLHEKGLGGKAQSQWRRLVTAGRLTEPPGQM